MLTICARWDTVQMPAHLEWRMYRQLRGAYEIDLFHFGSPELDNSTTSQHGSMAEAIAATSGTRVFLEPGGADSLEDVPPGDIVLVVGNTESGNADLVQEGDYVVALPAKNPVDLYGVNAAAIALHELMRLGRI